jgi:hypothetical protein
MNDSKNLFSGHCDPCHGNCNACARASKAAQIDERDTGGVVVATAYSRSLLDVLVTLVAVLACSSVVCLFGVAP